MNTGRIVFFSLTIVVALCLFALGYALPGVIVLLALALWVWRLA